MKCVACGLPNADRKQIDPYESELRDDNTLVWLHDECAQRLADDV